MPAVFNQLTPWITAARPVAHGMIALPLVWGQAVAIAVAGQFSWGWLLVVQLFAVLIQIHSLYLNDYADEPLDRSNRDYWLSGGSRVVPDGKLTGQQLYRASFIPAVVILLMSAVAAFSGRPWMPVFALLALAASASYSLQPLKASYRGLGELHQGLSCGVGLPLCAYYLQTGSLVAFPWLWLLPLVMLFFASNIITALPDMASDASGGKLTYCVRHGAQTAKQHAVLISLLAAMFGLFFTLQSGLAGSSLLGAGLAALPVILFGSMLFLGMAADSKNTKRFMALIIIGHLWLMVSWTAQLFWIAK